MTYVGVAAKALFTLIVNLMALAMTWFMVVATYAVVGSLAGPTAGWIAGGVAAVALFLVVWLDDAVAIGQLVGQGARKLAHAMRAAAPQPSHPVGAATTVPAPRAVVVTARASAPVRPQLQG